MRAVIDRLWVERRLLELLELKLVATGLFIAAGMHRFVARSLVEVEEVLALVRSAELGRGVCVAGLADEWNVPVSSVTLPYLVDHAAEPAASIFAEHREALRTVTDEIEEFTARNRLVAVPALRARHAHGHPLVPSLADFLG
jgi:hypothetical protein